MIPSLQLAMLCPDHCHWRPRLDGRHDLPHTYFLGMSRSSAFFNRGASAPSGKSQATIRARVSDMGEERASDYYASQARGRLVKQVDWLDKKGQLRPSELYDKQGRCFAKTAYINQARRLTRPITALMVRSVSWKITPPVTSS